MFRTNILLTSHGVCVCLILCDFWLCVSFLGVVLFCSLSFGELVVVLGFCLSIEKELTVWQVGEEWIQKDLEEGKSMIKIQSLF